MAILTVGSGEEYSTLTAAVAASQNGDTIAVNAGTYVNDFPETITDNITIEGVGGMATFEATEAVPNGKAILVTNGNDTINNLAFTGATVSDDNGAGIKFQGGNLVLNNDYFYNNQEGLLAGVVPSATGTGTIAINNTEFANNGGDGGYAHNIYVGQIESLTINDSLFTGAIEGHEIKSDAENTTIENSRIIDGPNGTASYDIDLPYGGNAVIENNVIEKGPNSENPYVVFVGDTAPVWATSVTIENNTIVNDLHKADVGLLYNDQSVPVSLVDNQIYGLTASQIAIGASTQSGNTFLTTEPTLDLSPPYDTSGSSGSTGSSGGGSGAPTEAQVLAELATLPLPQPNQAMAVLEATQPNEAVHGQGATLAIGEATGDTLFAGKAFSVLYAGPGTETLEGGSANTDFLGGTGTDYLVTGNGGNYIETGTGSETIEFTIGHGGSGNTTIYGFNSSLDHIDISGTTATAASLVAGATNDAAGDAIIHLGSHEITLQGISSAHLSADWFTIVN